MKILLEQVDTLSVKLHKPDSTRHVTISDSSNLPKLINKVDSTTKVKTYFSNVKITSSHTLQNVKRIDLPLVDSSFLTNTSSLHASINLKTIQSVDYKLDNRLGLPDYSARSECYNFERFSNQVFVMEKPKPSTTGQIKRIDHFYNQSSWFFTLVFILLAGFTAFRIYYGKYFSSIFAGAFNSREAARFYTSKTNQFPQIKLLTYTVLLFSIGIFAFNYLHLQFKNFVPTISSLAYIYAVIGVYMFYRNVVGSLIQLITNEKEYFQLLNYNLFIYNFLITIIVLFFAFFSIYLTPGEQIYPLILGFLISCIVLVMRTIRSFQLFIRNRFSIFYWILYFCALEVLPLAGLYFGFKRLVIIA